MDVFETRGSQALGVVFAGFDAAAGDVECGGDVLVPVHYAGGGVVLAIVRDELTDVLELDVGAGFQCATDVLAGQNVDGPCTKLL